MQCFGSSCVQGWLSESQGGQRDWVVVPDVWVVGCRLRAVLSKSCSAVGHRQISPGVLEIWHWFGLEGALKPICSQGHPPLSQVLRSIHPSLELFQGWEVNKPYQCSPFSADPQWRYARRFLWVLLSSWGTAVLFESESCKIPSRMALVDKHKVKRQRLDRICEGKSVLSFFWWMIRVGYLIFPCFFQYLGIKTSKSRAGFPVLSVFSKYIHTALVTHLEIMCSPVNKIFV